MDVTHPSILTASNGAGASDCEICTATEASAPSLPAAEVRTAADYARRKGSSHTTGVLVRFSAFSHVDSELQTRSPPA